MILSSIYYTLIGWLNYPSTSTPLGQRNLRHMDEGILQNAQNIVALSQDKAEASEVQTMVQSISMDADTGIMTVTYKNGSVDTYDLAIEKVVANFRITDDNVLILELADGTQQNIDLIRFVNTVNSSNTISMTMRNRVITAEVIDGSITEAKLEATIMAAIREYTQNAQIAADSAVTHDEGAQSWAVGGTGSREDEDTDNSKYYSEKAREYADNAASYANILLPEFYVNLTTGHLWVKEGNNVDVYIENDHLIVEV